jgi:hypothetical protein
MRRLRRAHVAEASELDMLAGAYAANALHNTQTQFDDARHTVRRVAQAMLKRHNSQATFATPDRFQRDNAVTESHAAIQNQPTAGADAAR